MTHNELNELYEKALKAKAAGDLQAAYTMLEQCVAANPNECSYRFHLSLVAYEIQKPSEQMREIAYFHAGEAVKLKPEDVNHWIAFGEIALNCYKFPEAIAAYEKAVMMDDKNAKVWGVLGFAYARIGKGKEAKRCYERAVAIDPELGDVHFLLSCMYVDDDYNPPAQAFHGEKGFTAEKPARFAVESMWNAAHGFLMSGDYEKGWQYFQARLKRNITNQGQMLPQDRFKKPLWNGQRNCRVLVSHEMGFGDCFLFMRFLHIFAAQHELELQFECMPQLINLVQYNLPGIHCVPYGEANEDKFDFHLPMMTLPLVCSMKNDSPVWPGAYVLPEREKIDEWKEKITLATPPTMNVGICWTTGARHYNSMNYETHRKKSLTFEQIQPVLALPANFISLQPESPELVNPGIKDFSDTAAIISLLDLVITVDTSVANLAGAMGKATWLLDRYDTCWRWSPNNVQPWFPNVIVFRQPQNGDWDGALKELLVTYPKYPTIKN